MVNISICTYQVNILHYVLKGRVSSKLFEELPFVEQRVHQVRVVVERVGQAGVDDLQHHSNHFFDDI